jgi:hypothetical protein
MNDSGLAASELDIGQLYKPKGWSYGEL